MDDETEPRGRGARGADAGAGTDGDVATPARPAPPPLTHCQLMQPIQLSANHYKCITTDSVIIRILTQICLVTSLVLILSYKCIIIIFIA